MTYSEDHIALAAEYALGTLDADERALVETMMIVDRGFMDVVAAWEHKLAPLHQMVGSVEPPDYVWDNIKAAAGLTGKQMPMSEMPVYVPPPPVEEPPSAYVPEKPAPVPEPPPSYRQLAPSEEDIARARAEIEAAVRAAQPPKIEPDIVVAPVPPPESVAPPAPAPPPRIEPERTNVVDISSRRRGAPVFGFLMTAVAASLAAVVALQAYRPELLPEQFRVKPKIVTVEVKVPPPPVGSQFVALLQQDTSLPAFILTVDTATKNFTVRKVGAVTEPGKSYELWLVSDKLAKPRSLGVIGNSDFTVRPSLAAFDSDTINKATYAVTLEPEGGSPTGSATGPIVFTGKLVESVPTLPAANR
ncbi:MAG: anti-sigma factor [Rhizobiales bacterium]|nr:anti-sigma factor [Hyphomicrobiales bacterium]